MGEFSLAAAILGFCILLALFEVVMANRNQKEGANATDWKRARGIVWIGVVLAALAWFVQRMMD
jgi:hypothetical protein